MQDNSQVTTALIDLYKDEDWLLRLNFQALIRLSGMLRLPKDARVLDCGCATGRLLKHLERYGFTNLHGVDSSPQMTVRAEALTKREITCCDALRLSDKFMPATFDAVTAMNLQHHLGKEREWEVFVSECGRIIKGGGLLIIREPYPTLMFNALRWMTRHSLLFKIRFLQSRLKSLIEEKELLYYFLDKWPGHYKVSLERNHFVILKDFCWVGHKIVVARKR